LPKEQNTVRETKPENVIISVNPSGQIFLYDTPVKSGQDLRKQLDKFAKMTTQPEVQIRGDGQSKFEAVGKVMSAVQQSGIHKVSFITDPSH
jgi:biopolymer transport protein ExbD